LQSQTVNGDLFSIADFGHPFESVLSARAEGTGEGGTRLSFAIRMKRTMPAVFLTLLIATVWPGVWLTDSMIRSYFTGYSFHTWMWYLPLTIPCIPWFMWSASRKSRVSGEGDGLELIEKVAAVVEGKVEGRAAEPRPALVESSV
jgi:hypothetical protein